jgi:hypothetical protein
LREVPVETIVCASHPARRASLTCERCGNFACSECAIDAPWGVSVCEPCKSRGSLCYPLAWESGSMLNPLRFARSAHDILFDAPTLFAYLPRDGIGRAVGFSAWVAVCIALCAVTTEALQLRLDFSDLPTLRALSIYSASLFAEQVARTYVIVLVSGLGFHVIARAFGGAASPDVALRTAAYGSTFMLFNVATSLVVALAPYLELAALVSAVLLQGYFYFTCLAIAAVEHYGVSRRRGEAIAGATLLMVVPSAFLAMTLITALGMYGARFSALWAH